MKKLITLILVAALVLVPAVALAAAWNMRFVIREAGDIAYSDTPVCCGVDHLWMADQIYMTPSGRDTKAMGSAGVALPHMVVDDGLWVVTNIPASHFINVGYSTANTPEDYEIIAGLGGYVTISDNASLELSGDFIIDVAGFYKTTAPFVGENILYKANAYRLYISGTGNITSEVDGGGSITATGVPTGWHILFVETVSGNMTLTVDSNYIGWVATANVTDSVDDWVLGSDATPYFTYLKITQ